MDNFATLDRRARDGETLSVAFFGGSLTWGAQSSDPLRFSYRALVSARLCERYPKARFVFWDGAIGGTGSQLGAFRLQRDVLAHKPDLAFLEFTINDDAFSAPDPDRLASYEALARRMLQAGVPVLQIILPAKKDVLPDPPERPLDAAHKAIGEAYGLPLADAVPLVKARVAEGKASPDRLWDTPGDATHPGDAGYALYAEAVWAAWEKAVAEAAQCRIPERMLNADTYMSVNRFELARLEKLPRGWAVGQPNRTAICFDFTPSRWMGPEAVATAAGGVMPEALVLLARGKNLMLFGEATPQSGQYRVVVDGQEVKREDLGKLAPHGNWRYADLVAKGLDASVEHRVEIIPVLASGQELRLESLCVAGAPAAVKPGSAVK